MSEDVIFDGKEDIDNWEPVQDSPDDYNDYDKEFIKTEDIEEGDYWIGSYAGVTENWKFNKVTLDNDDEKVTYCFPKNTFLINQVEQLEEGDEIAILYEGKVELDESPNAANAWEVRRKPQ